jgi:hypothetical protein
MALRTVAAALVCCALIPSVAQASSRPSFPKTVTGEISGSHSGTRDGQTNKESWTIKDVRFRLAHVRYVENTWTGFYNVTGGTVTFSESQSGACSYSLEKTFPLKPNMPSSKTTTPFSMTRNMSGHDSYGGGIWPKLHWNATETCSYPGGEPTTNTVPLEPGNLFNANSPPSFRIGKAMKGTYKYYDDYLNATTIFKWSLKPRR